MAHFTLRALLRVVIIVIATASLALGLTLRADGTVHSTTRGSIQFASATQSEVPTTIDVFAVNPPPPVLQSRGLTIDRVATNVPTTVVPTPAAPSAAPSPGSLATTTLPSAAALSALPTTVTPATSLVHQPGPVVSSLPAGSCTSQSLTANLTSAGPTEAMGVAEWIITVTSSTPCTVNGYPTLAFSGATASNSVLDGGIGGNPGPAPQSPVALGTSVPASFLVELSDYTPSPSCSPANSLLLGVPGDAPSVVVTPDAAIGSWWSCPGTKVSPFEQGNSISNYA